MTQSDGLLIHFVQGKETKVMDSLQKPGKGNPKVLTIKQRDVDTVSCNRKVKKSSHSERCI